MITREILFATLSLLIAALFGWGFLTQAGFPPTKIQENWIGLVVTLIFFIIPFAKKLDFFQFFSFEAKIDEVKKEINETKQDVNDAKSKVADVRQDVRHLISQNNALSASLHLISHQAVTVNNNYERPPQEQLDAAQAEVADVQPVVPDEFLPISNEERLIKAIFGKEQNADEATAHRTLADLYVNAGEIDALKRLGLSEQVGVLRIRVERELRRITEPHLTTTVLTKGWKMPVRQVLKNATRHYPHLREQSESFDIFFLIANAAVHGDDVPVNDLETAIYIGERLLSLLSGIATGSHEDGAD